MAVRQEARVECENPLDGIYHCCIYPDYGSWERRGSVWTDRASGKGESEGGDLGYEGGGRE